VRNLFRKFKQLEQNFLLHDSYIYRAVWIATVAAEILALAYAITTGNFHPFVMWALLTPMGFCCAFQAVNHVATSCIAKEQNKISEKYFLASAVREAIAAIQLPTPISQLAPTSVSLFGRLMPTPAPSIDQISANTPLHFAS
jgi:hypothetical protein